MTSAELLAQVAAAGGRLSVKDDRLLIDAPQGALSPQLITQLKERKTELVQLIRSELDYWFNRLRECRTRQEVISLLDEFRPLPWTDYQRAEMSRAYINRLNSLGRDTQLHP